MTLVLEKKESVLGSILLIAGCCIGAGMIGLPVISALTGFLPSTLAILLSYLFTTATGLILLEATLWFEHKVNLLSIAYFVLGTFGKWFAGFLFLFLFYSIFVAYMDGGGQLFAAGLSVLFDFSVPQHMGAIACAIFVGLLISSGTRMVDWLNRGFMLGLILSYGALIAVGISHIEGSRLIQSDWNPFLRTLPILFICFGYHNLVPSISYYLKRNVKALRFAIIVGNALPLFFYLIWNGVIIGLLPSEMFHAAAGASMVSEMLEKVSGSPSVILLIKVFSFFALITSFLGIGISFVDFFKDAFKVATIKGEMMISGLVLIPPLLISLSYPHLFLNALEFAGGVINVILFGILPIVIVWVGRYRKGVTGIYKVAGGKLFLSVMFAICLGLLFFNLF